MRALGLEEVQRRTVLPSGCGEAREAIEGGIAEQVGPVEKEAGVRKQHQAAGGARGHTKVG